MLGRQESGQGQFFYSFDLDKVVPVDHLVRQIDAFLDLSWVHNELAPFYSHTGRPSIDPVLMIRMLVFAYVFALRSERRLCAEVLVNLAYRWFCKLGIEDHIPDHSVFCRARRERFRESDALRRVFERVVALCILAGLVGGEAFSVDASLIKPDVNKTRRLPGDQPLPGQRRRKHPMRCASTSQRLMLPIAIRTAMRTAAVQVKAAVAASLPRKSRSPIRKQHGLRGRAWIHSLLMMRTI